MDLAATLSVVKEKMNTVKNVVMNYSETEAKVRKATDNEAWGPSGTEMSQLAQLTNYIEDFQTIMEVIYKRVRRGGGPDRSRDPRRRTDTAPQPDLRARRGAQFAEHGKNWRHVYKALILLEYLIKNGHERVVYNAKDHIYELKGLSHFEYIDDKGKDQGINVRNRSKEIVNLLNDVDRLKEERRTGTSKTGRDARGLAAVQRWALTWRRACVGAGGRWAGTAKKNRDKYVGVSSHDYDRCTRWEPRPPLRMPPVALLMQVRPPGLVRGGTGAQTARRRRRRGGPSMTTRRTCS